MVGRSVKSFFCFIFLVKKSVFYACFTLFGSWMGDKNFGVGIFLNKKHVSAGYRKQTSFLGLTCIAVLKKYYWFHLVMLLGHVKYVLLSPYIWHQLLCGCGVNGRYDFVSKCMFVNILYSIESDTASKHIVHVFKHKCNYSFGYGNIWCMLISCIYTHTYTHMYIYMWVGVYLIKQSASESEIMELFLFMLVWSCRYPLLFLNEVYIWGLFNWYF